MPRAACSCWGRRAWIRSRSILRRSARAFGRTNSRCRKDWGARCRAHRLASVAWLANTLGSYGVSLSAGDIILSGSLVPLEPAEPGDMFRMELEGVGSASVAFA